MTAGAPVLVPLDGSAFAERALPLARLVARLGGGSLLLAHVVEPPMLVSDLQGEMGTDPRTTRELRRAAQDYLDDVVARMTRDLRARRPDGAMPSIPTAPDAVPAAPAGDLSLSAGRFGDVPLDEVPVRGVLLDGDTAHALHDAAVIHGAGLVVMASRDRSALGRLVVGSTAEAVAREPGVPVLIVRAIEAPADTDVTVTSDADATAHEAPRPRHLLVPLDGSPEAEAVLLPALALARQLDAAVTLATVHDPRRDRAATLLPTALLAPDGGDEHRAVGVGAEAPAEEDAYLGALARRLAADEHRVGTRVVRGHDVADAIVQCASDVGADLIAMSTHGRGAWGRLVHGSVADAVLHRVLMPVLLLRPAPAEGAEVVR